MRGAKRLALQATLIMALAIGLGLPRGAVAAPEASAKLDKDQKETLRHYAADTWKSFVSLTDPATGLPSDNVSATGERSQYTSPTNIATYLWSTLAARDLRIISKGEALDRIGTTLATLAKLERHTPSGQFYNWYSPATGAKLTTWPVDGGTVYPFLSSVDNGWLAAALIMVANGVPQLRDEARALTSSMDFGCYYDPAEGLIRGGFWDTTAPPGTWPVGNYCGKGANVTYTGHHYGTLNTEPRIASYIGIAWGQIPPTHYFKMWRTFPPTCDWGWPETQPAGVTRTYMGVSVFEGHYTYRDMNIVPTWGGSMFEALMVPLLVPEESWGKKSWGVNHPLYVRAQIEHGLDEAHYGYWGFSPSNDPAGGYREYGVDQIGMNPDGYTSDEERTTVDNGFKDPSGNGYCPGREPKPAPASYGQGVVTPHASFLALEFAPDAAMQNLAKLREHFGVYGPGGFYDAVNVKTGAVSQHYLALDQGMIMASIANALKNDKLQRYFTHGAVQKAIKPLLKIEEFTAGDEQQ